VLKQILRLVVGYVVAQLHDEVVHLETHKLLVVLEVGIQPSLLILQLAHHCQEERLEAFEQRTDFDSIFILFAFSGVGVHQNVRYVVEQLDLVIAAVSVQVGEGVVFGLGSYIQREHAVPEVAERKHLTQIPFQLVQR